MVPSSRTSIELLALVGVLIGLLYLGLWPLDLFPPNPVGISDDAGGLRFEGRAIAFTESEVDWRASGATSANGFTLEVWAVPERPLTWRDKTVVAFVDGREFPVFELVHRRTSVSFRYRDAAARWTRTLTLARIFRADAPLYVAVTVDPDETTLFVSGSRDDLLRYPHSILSAGALPAGRLVLGNAAHGFAEWRGVIRGLAVHQRVLREDERSAHAASSGPDASADSPDLRAVYAFGDVESGSVRVDRVPNDRAAGEDVVIPATFRALDRGFFEWPHGSPFASRVMRRDVANNLLGFVPVGLLVARLLASVAACRGLARRLAFAFAFAFLVSLAIEWAQSYLPSRHSSLLDLALNVSGALIGAALLVAIEAALCLVGPTRQGRAGGDAR